MHDIGLLYKEDLDDDWKASYFKRFQSMQQAIRDAPELSSFLADFDEWHRQLQDHNETLYASHQISAFHYSYLLLLEEALGACRRRIESLEDMDFFALTALLHLLGEMSLATEQMRDYRESVTGLYRKQLEATFLPEPWLSVFTTVLRKEPDFARPKLRWIAVYIVRTLVRLGLLDEFRDVIRFVYSSYKELVQRLYDESDNEASWKALLKTTIAHAAMSQVLSVQVAVGQEHQPAILIGISDGRAEFRAGVKWNTNPLFAQVFAPRELESLAEEGKRIDEVFAHCIVAVGSDDSSISRIEDKIRKVRRTQGRITARQLLRSRLLCFGWQEANRHLAITIDCLANNEVKKSSARCPSSRHLWAYRINPSMSACAC